MLSGFVVLIAKRRLSRPRRSEAESRFLRVVDGHLTNVRVGIVAKRQDRIVSGIEGGAYPAFYNFLLLKQPAGTPTGNIFQSILLTG